MTITELLAIFRAEVFDTAAPYLWSDALIYGYMDDAQKQFCRDTYGIEDARSFSVQVQPAVEWYAIDPRILKLRSAIDPATGRDVPLVAVEKMRDENLRFDGTVGPLRVLITGLEKGMVRALPIPNTASAVELRTFRLPEDIAKGDDFEIDEQHVRNLLLWVKYRAYSVHDAETYNPKLAKENFDAFADYCKKAKVEQSRARRPVGNVAYGGL